MASPVWARRPRLAGTAESAPLKEPPQGAVKRKREMFAVIKTGGKQYKVAKDDLLTIEKLAADADETVQFNDVLMVGGDSLTIGDPMIEDAAVQALVVSQERGEKVINFKKRRRKHSSKRLKGHRQYLTVVKITDILPSGGSASGVKAAIGAGTAGASIVKAGAPAEAASAPTPAAEAKPDPVAEEAIEASRPSNLLEAPQGEADDLTRISGVGPGLNEKLNNNGVFHFWQIAEWGPTEIAFMDDQLSFKGRIERDNWIEQAKGFAAETE